VSEPVTIGMATELHGYDVEVLRHQNGAVVLDMEECVRVFAPEHAAVLAELVQRAAMPGQGADGEPPATDAPGPLPAVDVTGPFTGIHGATLWLGADHDAVVVAERTLELPEARRFHAALGAEITRREAWKAAHDAEEAADEDGCGDGAPVLCQAHGGEYGPADCDECHRERTTQQGHALYHEQHCRCGHKKGVHAGRDATGRCVLRRCGCGMFEAATEARSE